MMTEELFKQYWEARRKEIEKGNNKRTIVLPINQKDEAKYQKEMYDIYGCSDWKSNWIDENKIIHITCVLENITAPAPQFTMCNIRYKTQEDDEDNIMRKGIRKYLDLQIQKIHEEAYIDFELYRILRKIDVICVTIYLDNVYLNELSFDKIDSKIVYKSNYDIAWTYSVKWKIVILKSYIGNVSIPCDNIESIVIDTSCVKIHNDTLLERYEIKDIMVFIFNSIVSIDIPVNIKINQDFNTVKSILQSSPDYLPYKLFQRQNFDTFVFLQCDKYNDYGTIGFRKNNNSSSNFLLLKNIGFEKITLDNMNLSEDFLYLTIDKAENITPFNPENASFIACTLDDANFINVADPRLKMDLIKRFRHVFNKDVYFREAEILQHEELRLQIANFEKPEWLQKMSDKLKRIDNYMKKASDYLKQKCLTIIVKIIHFITFEIIRFLDFVLKCMCVSKGKSEYLIIKCSDYFSDFGKSLWRPFRLLFFIAFFFFLMTHCSGYLGKYNFSLSGEWLLSDFLADMFSAMIALPSLIDFQNPEFFATGWAKLCNIILFIIIKFLTGYLLYNFIRATRRYSK